MKIAVLGMNYWPDETGAAVYNTGRCEFLASRGHAVTMYTAPPYYPEWRIKDGYHALAFSAEERNGVRIVRSPLFVPKKTNVLSRMLHEASFAASALARVAVGSRPDVLLTVSPPLGLGVVATILCRIWNRPFVFHVEDLQPDTALTLGMLRESALVTTLLRVEKFIYRHATIVSTLNSAMRDRIAAKLGTTDKLEIVPGWADPGVLEIERRDGTSFRQVHGLNDALVVTHPGNMGVKQGLETVLEAAALLRSRKDIKFLLVGDGAAERSLRLRKDELMLDNLEMWALQDRPRFLELLAATDVGLLVQRREMADVVFASKLTTMMGAAQPIVASITSSSVAADVIRSAECGVLAEPENPQALADAVVRMSQQPDELRMLGRQARSYAKSHWSYQNILQHLESCLFKSVKNFD